MQGSNNGRIKMARQKAHFDDESWNYSNYGGSKSQAKHKTQKVKHKSNKPHHTEKLNF